MSLHKLEVVSPQTEIAADTIRILEETLAEAKAGKIEEVVILTYDSKNVEEPFGYHIGPTRGLMKWIGHLETTKFDWIIHSKGL
jgi:hypothetical protein